MQNDIFDSQSQYRLKEVKNIYNVFCTALEFKQIICEVM